MTYLSDHARATRILGHAFAEESTNPHLPLERRMMLRSISAAYHTAAGLMDAEAKASVLDHACTIDHRALTVPKCPACGASRG